MRAQNKAHTKPDKGIRGLVKIMGRTYGSSMEQKVGSEPGHQNELTIRHGEQQTVYTHYCTLIVYLYAQSLHMTQMAPL